MSFLDVIFYENGVEKLNTFEMEQKIPFLAMAELKNDTIKIIGYAGFFVGFGFNSTITKSNKNQNFLSVRTDEYSIYKLNKSDSLLCQELVVPSLTSTLTLTRIPEFNLGDTIKGKLELASTNFFNIDVNEYYFREEGEEYKGVEETEEKVILKAYFVAVIKD